MLDNKSVLLLRKDDEILDKINQKIKARKFSCDDIYPKTHKSFLQDILNVIKQIQLELLSKISTPKKNNQFPNKEIINLLKDLKIELSTTFQENVQTKLTLEHDNKMIRKSLSNKIFNKSEKTMEIKKQETPTQFPTQLNYPKLNSEISELKSLNFKIENQIESIEAKINIISSNKFNNKNGQKYNYLFFEGRNVGMPPENLLHTDLINTREKFKFVAKKKDFQNKFIIQISTAIDLVKEEYKLQNKKNHNEYIITSQIINEETKEYQIKTTKFENEVCCNNKNIGDIENDFLYKGKLICVNN